MKHTTTKTIKNAHNSYIKSNLYTLNDCYTNASYYKQIAYNRCRDLVKEYNGRQSRIIGYNSQTFSFGFIGTINEKPAFFYITKDYDRYIYIDELEA